MRTRRPRKPAREQRREPQRGSLIARPLIPRSVPWAYVGLVDRFSLRGNAFFHCTPLVVGRALVAQRRVNPLSVVEDLAIFEHRTPHLPSGRPGPSVQQLTFQGRHKRFREGVVVRVGHRAHGGYDPRLLELPAQ